jgi:hypothetical protein
LRNLRLIVGVTALLAPLLHSITDAMEWSHGGFSVLQLWLNYLAFVPIPPRIRHHSRSTHV